MSFLKSIWKNNSKHKKLSEELKEQKDKEADTQQLEPCDTDKDKEKEKEKDKDKDKDKDVMNFKLKYLGSTAVEKLSGDSISPEAVKNVIKVAKASGKKLQRVNVEISLKGIHVTDTKGNDMFDISIYKISNCSTDKQFRQVFSFISVDESERTELHAFWCSKRKMAEMVALTVAHAFSTAYETWRTSPNDGEFGKHGSMQNENMKNTLNTMKNSLMEEEKGEEVTEEKLIDFDDDPVEGITITSAESSPKSQWVGFDDDFGNLSDAQESKPEFSCDFESAFTKNNQENQLRVSPNNFLSATGSLSSSFSSQSSFNHQNGSHNGVSQNSQNGSFSGSQNGSFSGSQNSSFSSQNSFLNSSFITNQKNLINSQHNFSDSGFSSPNIISSHNGFSQNGGDISSQNGFALKNGFHGFESSQTAVSQNGFDSPKLRNQNVFLSQNPFEQPNGFDFEDYEAQVFITQSAIDNQAPSQNGHDSQNVIEKPVFNRQNFQCAFSSPEDFEAQTMSYFTMQNGFQNTLETHRWNPPAKVDPLF